MRVIYNKVFTDDFKSDYFTLNFLMPLDDTAAASCALLAQVLRRGCEKYGEMSEIAARLEMLYGATVQISSDKIGENLSLTAQASFLDNRFALDGENICMQSIDVLAEILLHPFTEGEAFRADFFEQEKQNLADYIKGQINDKRTYSMMRCKEIMFENQPYRFTSTGSLESLKSISAASLYSFYREILENTQILVTYVGRKTDVEAIMQHYFAPLLRGDGTALCAPRYVAAAHEKQLDEAMDVVQGKLCMGYRFFDKVDVYAARLFNVIFGGSPTSKLFLNVREKMSLCYYCTSGFDPFVNSIFISSGIEFDNFEVAKQEIFHQLQDMQKGNITAEEFENGKLYLLDFIKGMKDSPNLMLSDAVRSFLLSCKDDIDLQLEKISRLQIEDIVRTANCLCLDTIYFLHGKEDK